ncbi:hypothetical protein OO012_06240 [Rhodobacteraceae bacterium KMM 6894]|nr:hypothetical protein [Rhodobacteraceae bacterium KMM 6894]
MSHRQVHEGIESVGFDLNGMTVMMVHVTHSNNVAGQDVLSVQDGYSPPLPYVFDSGTTADTLVAAPPRVVVIQPQITQPITM